jgi:O-antigen/teichoic acid export membrane protein
MRQSTQASPQRQIETMSNVAVMSILLNIALVPLAGALGAAIASAVCLATMNLIAAYLVWSRLGIWTIPFVWIKGYA